MTKIKAILTKPLDGQPEGTEREFDRSDFEELRRMGAVRTPGEISTRAPILPAPEEKAALPVLNKAAPAVANKSEPVARGTKG